MASKSKSTTETQDASAHEHGHDQPCSGCAENAKLQAAAQANRLAFIHALASAGAELNVNITLMDVRTPYGGGEYLGITSFGDDTSKDAVRSMATAVKAAVDS